MSVLFALNVGGEGLIGAFGICLEQIKEKFLRPLSLRMQLFNLEFDVPVEFVNVMSDCCNVSRELRFLLIAITVAFVLV